MSEFVHLHCHTEYSLLDGAIRLNDLCARAKDFGMPAAAITDHGNLYGAGTVVGRNAGGHSFSSLDRSSECRVI